MPRSVLSVDAFERLVTVVMWAFGVLAVLSEPVILVAVGGVLVMRYVHDGHLRST